MSSPPWHEKQVTFPELARLKEEHNLETVQVLEKPPMRYRLRFIFCLREKESTVDSSPGP